MDMQQIISRYRELIDKKIVTPTAAPDGRPGFKIRRFDLDGAELATVLLIPVEQDIAQIQRWRADAVRLVEEIDQVMNDLASVGDPADAGARPNGSKPKGRRHDRPATSTIDGPGRG